MVAVTLVLGAGDFALTLGGLRWEGSVQQPLARFYSMRC